MTRTLYILATLASRSGSCFSGLCPLALNFFVGFDNVVADFVSFPRTGFLAGEMTITK